MAGNLAKQRHYKKIVKLEWEVRQKKPPKKKFYKLLWREIHHNKNAKKPRELAWNRGSCPRLKDTQRATIFFEVPQVPKIGEINSNC